MPVKRDMAELGVLHASSELTIMKAIWSPGMKLPPHNHRIWNAIGGLRRDRGEPLLPARRRRHRGVGGKDLAAGDVTQLGRDIIHSVINPRPHEYTGAIHIYGGDFMHEPRSVWPGDPPPEEPATGETMQGYFERVNEERDTMSLES